MGWVRETLISKTGVVLPSFCFDDNELREHIVIAAVTVIPDKEFLELDSLVLNWLNLAVVALRRGQQVPTFPDEDY